MAGLDWRAIEGATLVRESFRSHRRPPSAGGSTARRRSPANSRPFAVQDPIPSADAPPGPALTGLIDDLLSDRFREQMAQSSDSTRGSAGLGDPSRPVFRARWPHPHRFQVEGAVAADLSQRDWSGGEGQCGSWRTGRLRHRAGGDSGKPGVDGGVPAQRHIPGMGIRLSSANAGRCSSTTFEVARLRSSACCGIVCRPSPSSSWPRPVAAPLGTAGDPRVWYLTTGEAGTREQARGLRPQSRPDAEEATGRRQSPMGRWDRRFGGPSARRRSGRSRGRLEPPWPDVLVSCGRRSALVAMAISAATAPHGLRSTSSRRPTLRLSISWSPWPTTGCGRQRHPDRHRASRRAARGAVGGGGARATPALSACPGRGPVCCWAARRAADPFTYEDAGRLADQLDASRDRAGGSLLVTPSRRTPGHPGRRTGRALPVGSDRAHLGQRSAPTPTSRSWRVGQARW